MANMGVGLYNLHPQCSGSRNLTALHGDPTDPYAPTRKYRMHWSHSSRPVLCSLAVWGAFVLALGMLAPATQAQSPLDGVQQRANAAFHGADGQGKDGPLAKVGGDLTRLYYEHDAHIASGAKSPFVPRVRPMPVRDGYVTIDAVAQTNAVALVADLKALGLQDAAVAGRMVSGRLPIAAIPEAAALTDLRFARPARALLLRGDATTQGDAAMQADEARMMYTVDGSGVKVGVMSDSYDDYDGSPATTASDDVTSGDLPGADNPNGFTTPVEVLDDTEGPNKDEGRAMLQIIHDIAPGAALSFHTALGGQASMVQGIRDLADAGADIIVDDVLYFREPMFQDGIVAQAVDDVKNNDGVAYFSAAGNLADQSWEEQFIGSGQDGPLGDSSGDLHRFGGSSTCQLITVPQGKTITFIFQWDEPYASAGVSNPGSSSDLDIFVRDKVEGPIIVESEEPNVGNDPIEILDFKNDGSTDADGDGEPDEQFCFGIELQEGTGPGLMKYVWGPQPPASGGIMVPNSNKPTIYGHANAKGAEAVAASSFGSTKSPRSYTSLGGVSILFDTDGNRQQDDSSRQKPGITGPDCVDNTFFGSGNTFCGTSAAAPHAAAVAALMLENRSALTVDGLYGELRATAEDIGASGVDALSGAGFIDALDAALPVELVAFDAVTDGRDIVLTWQTASETNNAGFRVEKRRTQGAFERVAFVPGAGTTMETQTYQHRLADLAPGTYAFRLQQVDTDGTVHPSPVVEATLALEDAYQLSTVYPNPVQTTATLELLVREPQTVRAVVYDAIGRQVQVLHNGPVAPHEPVPLTLGADKLPSGLYLIRIHGEAFSATRRATVVR